MKSYITTLRCHSASLVITLHCILQIWSHVISLGHLWWWSILTELMPGRHQWSWLFIDQQKWPIITYSDHIFQSNSPHSHGKLKSSAPVSGKGLPKIETGMASSTQIAVAASKAGSRLDRWQFGSDLDLDWSRDFFSCLARNFCSCCSCLILCASHLGKANKCFPSIYFIGTIPFSLLLVFLMFVVALQVAGVISRFCRLSGVKWVGWLYPPCWPLCFC